MPTVDLTPRLVRQSKPGPKDLFLFDRSLPGFGLRIHPSGRKVYIVQARIDGRSRRIAIARNSDMELAEARIRAGENPADDIRREKETPRSGNSRTSTCGAAIRTGSPPGARPCATTSSPAFCPPSAGCSVSRARLGAANRAFEILRAMMFRAEE